MKKSLKVIAAVLLTALVASCQSTEVVDGDPNVAKGINAWNTRGPDAATAYWTDIEDAAFLQCTALRRIIFNEPASQKTVVIGQGAFMDCAHLDTVTFTDGKTALDIKTGAFKNTKTYAD